MIYKCIKSYSGKLVGEKGHYYAMSENSAQELELNKLNNYFTLLTEDEEQQYISGEVTRQ